MTTHSNRTLWYKKAAAYWEEALPLGNGNLGAMLYSGTENDIIMMNDDTLWSGYPRDKSVPDAYSHYIKARDLSLEGKYAQAQHEIEQNLLGEYTECYLPLCKVLLNFKDINENACTDYRRSLDISTALASSEFEFDGIKYRKEAFISAPEQSLYLKISADKKNALNFTAGLDCDLEHVLSAGGNSLMLRGIAPSYAAPNYLDCDNPVIYDEAALTALRSLGETEFAEKSFPCSGMRFMGMLSVETRGGHVSVNGNSLLVTCADEAIIRFCAATSFNGFNKHPFTEGKKEYEVCRLRMQNAASFSYEQARERHIAEYSSLFNSMELKTNCPPANPGCEDIPCDTLPTDERIRKFSGDDTDFGLIELFFHYNRYLLISSSRPGTQPANLQGIWNSQVRAPWSSNLTVNINTEMNYWGAEICGLGELHEPLINAVKELSEAGSKTARQYYNARGFVSHHNVDIWRHSTPVGIKSEGAACYGFWPMSSGWLCRHLYEHYEYTLDETFLKGIAYPLIRSAAEFYHDVLVEGKHGKLVFAPSTSPENRYLLDGKTLAVTESTAMTMSIIREVFSECISCAGILGVNDDFIDSLRTDLTRLLDLQIGSDGRILEWNEELCETDLTHRHISHIYALHPSNQVTCRTAPELAGSFRKSLEERGDGGTGWSLCWKVNVWARLCDGDHALKLLKRLLNYAPASKLGLAGDRSNFRECGGVYENLFDAHPPFQIDGNLGTISGVAEMFLQSTAEELVLLPAIPHEFTSASICGIKAKGRVTADIHFERGRFVKAVLTTDKTQDRTLVFEVEGSYQEKRIHLEAGVPYTVDFKI